MEETTKKDGMPVYEISYLVSPSIPEEKLEGEVVALNKFLKESGAEVIAEEAPHMENLAYTMRKKTVSGAYEKCDEAYFGWVKFAIAPDKVDPLKKQFEKQASILRVLLVTTVRENTYLGKHASDVAASFSAKTETGDLKPHVKAVEKAEALPVTPLTKEEMDKSIDAMVNEAI